MLYSTVLYRFLMGVKLLAVPCSRKYLILLIFTLFSTVFDESVPPNTALTNHMDGEKYLPLNTQICIHLSTRVLLIYARTPAPARRVAARGRPKRAQGLSFACKRGCLSARAGGAGGSAWAHDPVFHILSRHTASCIRVTSARRVLCKMRGESAKIQPARRSGAHTSTAVH